MTDMTLEQLLGKIRDAQKLCAEDGQEMSFEGYAASRQATMYGLWADAIDAHLAKAAQGEAVAYRYRQADEPSKWMVFQSRARSEAMKESGLIVEPLYATPTITALAHPRPTGDAKVLTTQSILDRIEAVARQADSAMHSSDERHLRNTLEIVADDLTAIIAAERVHAPTGEQDGEVVASILPRLQRFDMHANQDDEGNVGPCRLIPRRSGELVRFDDVMVALEASQPRPVVVMDGYRLVPVEPTDDMCRNAREKIGIGSNVAHHVWHWMIAAAPDGEVG
jgi:hypothetical protein